MLFSQYCSESVAAGHPDKICDQISDGILDVALDLDPKSRVAIETLVTTNKVVLAGEITCSKKLNYEAIVRKIIANLGYTVTEWNFSDKADIEVCIHSQSPDIAQGVNDGGAGDQGMMFGYATRETKELMPMPIMVSHALVKKMDNTREEKILSYLRPDGKSEVVVDYENGLPVDIPIVVLAVPHDPKVENEELLIDLSEKVIMPVLNAYLPDRKTQYPKIIVNGTGKWEFGGPASDTGLTGRKIIVDTYGGIGRHGGGAFSGKDPTKVDRSVAYACRYLAKNVVAAGLADKCEIRAGYVIGKRNPLFVDVETFGTEKKDLKVIKDFAKNLLGLSVPEILQGLDLCKPIYQQTAVYGHFGNEKYPWEKIVRK